MFYTPNADKYPYLLDKDMMFYRAIGRKAYYLTLTREKENIHDAGDDTLTNDWGAESIYYIPCLKSFDNLDEIDELFINYIVIIKQGYFPDKFWDEEYYFKEADGLYRILKRNEDGLWDKLVSKYPILLKPEYNLKALNKSINFSFNHHEPIVWETYVEFKKYDKRADKGILDNFPDE